MSDSSNVHVNTPVEEPADTFREPFDRRIPQDERIGTIIFAIILTGFGLFWIWASAQLPQRSTSTYLSQAFVPLIAGVLLAAISALLAIGTWLAKPKPVSEARREPLFQPRAEMLAFATFVSLLVYIVILPHVHYAISTFLLSTAGLAIAGEPLRPKLLLIAAAMTALFFGIFIFGLQLPLPGSRYG